MKNHNENQTDQEDRNHNKSPIKERQSTVSINESKSNQQTPVSTWLGKPSESDKFQKTPNSKNQQVIQDGDTAAGADPGCNRVSLDLNDPKPSLKRILRPTKIKMGQRQNVYYGNDGAKLSSKPFMKESSTTRSHFTRGKSTMFDQSSKVNVAALPMALGAANTLKYDYRQSDPLLQSLLDIQEKGTISMHLQKNGLNHLVPNKKNFQQDTKQKSDLENGKKHFPSSNYNMLEKGKRRNDQQAIKNKLSIMSKTLGKFNTDSIKTGKQPFQSSQKINPQLIKKMKIDDMQDKNKVLNGDKKSSKKHHLNQKLLLKKIKSRGTEKKKETQDSQENENDYLKQSGTQLLRSIIKKRQFTTQPKTEKLESDSELTPFDQKDVEDNFRNFLKIMKFKHQQYEVLGNTRPSDNTLKISNNSVSSQNNGKGDENSGQQSNMEFQSAGNLSNVGGDILNGENSQAIREQINNQGSQDKLHEEIDDNQFQEMEGHNMEQFIPTNTEIVSPEQVQEILNMHDLHQVQPSDLSLDIMGQIQSITNMSSENMNVLFSFVTQQQGHNQLNVDNQQLNQDQPKQIFDPVTNQVYQISQVIPEENIQNEQQNPVQTDMQNQIHTVIENGCQFVPVKSNIDFDQYNKCVDAIQRYQQFRQQFSQMENGQQLQAENQQFQLLEKEALESLDYIREKEDQYYLAYKQIMNMIIEQFENENKLAAQQQQQEGQIIKDVLIRQMKIGKETIFEVTQQVIEAPELDQDKQEQLYLQHMDKTNPFFSDLFQYINGLVTDKGQSLDTFQQLIQDKFPQNFDDYVNYKHQQLQQYNQMKQALIQTQKGNEIIAKFGLSMEDLVISNDYNTLHIIINSLEEKDREILNAELQNYIANVRQDTKQVQDNLEIKDMNQQELDPNPTTALNLQGQQQLTNLSNENQVIYNKIVQKQLDGINKKDFPQHHIQTTDGLIEQTPEQVQISNNDPLTSDNQQQLLGQSLEEQVNGIDWQQLPVDQMQNTQLIWDPENQAYVEVMQIDQELLDKLMRQGTVEGQEGITHQTQDVNQNQQMVLQELKPNSQLNGQESAQEAAMQGYTIVQDENGQFHQVQLNANNEIMQNVMVPQQMQVIYPFSGSCRRHIEIALMIESQNKGIPVQAQDQQNQAEIQKQSLQVNGAIEVGQMPQMIEQQQFQQFQKVMGEDGLIYLIPVIMQYADQNQQEQAVANEANSNQMMEQIQQQQQLQVQAQQQTNPENVQVNQQQSSAKQVSILEESKQLVKEESQADNQLQANQAQQQQLIQQQYNQMSQLQPAQQLQMQNQKQQNQQQLLQQPSQANLQQQVQMQQQPNQVQMLQPPQVIHQQQLQQQQMNLHQNQMLQQLNQQQQQQQAQQNQTGLNLHEQSHQNRQQLQQQQELQPSGQICQLQPSNQQSQQQQQNQIQEESQRHQQTNVEVKREDSQVQNNNQQAEVQVIQNQVETSQQQQAEIVPMQTVDENGQLVLSFQNQEDFEKYLMQMQMQEQQKSQMQYVYQENEPQQIGDANQFQNQEQANNQNEQLDKAKGPGEAFTLEEIQQKLNEEAQMMQQYQEQHDGNMQYSTLPQGDFSSQIRLVNQDMKMQYMQPVQQQYFIPQIQNGQQMQAMQPSQLNMQQPQMQNQQQLQLQLQQQQSQLQQQISQQQTTQQQSQQQQSQPMSIQLGQPQQLQQQAHQPQQIQQQQQQAAQLQQVIYKQAFQQQQSAQLQQQFQLQNQQLQQPQQQSVQQLHQNAPQLQQQVSQLSQAHSSLPQQQQQINNQRKVVQNGADYSKRKNYLMIETKDKNTKIGQQVQQKMQIGQTQQKIQQLQLPQQFQGQVQYQQAQAQLPQVQAQQMQIPQAQTLQLAKQAPIQQQQIPHQQTQLSLLMPQQPQQQINAHQMAQQQLNQVHQHQQQVQQQQINMNNQNS